jgi:DNA-binding CsgD family transcriptional regulator
MTRIISISSQESAVLSALSAGQSLAAVARRYHTSPARIATLERSAGRKLALAARLRRMGFTVSEVVEDERAGTRWLRIEPPRWRSAVPAARRDGAGRVLGAWRDAKMKGRALGRSATALRPKGMGSV